MQIGIYIKRHKISTFFDIPGERQRRDRTLFSAAAAAVTVGGAWDTTRTTCGTTNECCSFAEEKTDGTPNANNTEVILECMNIGASLSAQHQKLQSPQTPHLCGGRARDARGSGSACCVRERENRGGWMCTRGTYSLSLPLLIAAAAANFFSKLAAP